MHPLVLNLFLNADKTKLLFFSKAKEIDFSLQICTLNGSWIEKGPH